MEKEIKKFVGMAQVYPEPSISLGNLVRGNLIDCWHTALNTTLTPNGIFKKRNKDYTLDFWISAYVNYKHIDSWMYPKDSLIIKGPTVSKRNKNIMYVLYIPYNPVVTDANPLTKLTQYFKKGIREVLEKLEYPEEDIVKALNAINDTPTS